MDVSLKWLSKFVDISGYTPKELADKITIAGVEVESITYLAQGSNLVIGHVLECVMHPQSDHLHVCKVDVGTEVVQIVCGAPNVMKGQKVIVSQVGAVLPAKGITIQKGVIRGEESCGMICSLSELGVDHKFQNEAQLAGIEVLPDDAPVGNTNPLAYLGLDDVIFEIKPTPNRGDVLSMLSFAYEVGAVLSRPVNSPTSLIEFDDLAKSNFTVNSATERCPNFSIKGIRGVVTKDSPKWLKEILRGAGVRSINNIVDIGNYVMLLLGQPLHMYDSDKLATPNYVVRDDYEGKFFSLDKQEHELIKGDIVVTNGNDVSCLGGVMGGYSTMVDENTKNLAVEAALFSSPSIRRTSFRLQMISDASTYFVRGVDESRSLLALDLAAKLLVELADAKVVEETVTYGNPNVGRNPISLSVEKTNKVLGTSFTLAQIASAFDRLNFFYTIEGETFKVTPPSYRKDITVLEDLIEEVIRLLGFDNLVSTYPVTTNVGYLTTEQKKCNVIRNHFINNGLDEALTYTLVSAKYIDDFTGILDASKGSTIKLLHPMTEEHAMVRKSLIPSLLLSVNYNYYHNQDHVKFFEISKVYSDDKEYTHLGIALSGTFSDLPWLKKNERVVDFYDVKGLVTGLFQCLGIEPNRYQLVKVEDTNKYYHFGRAAYIKTGNKIWGVIGEVHPQMINKYDLPRTVVAEIDLGYLYSIRTSPIKFTAPSSYPVMERDIAIVVDESTPTQDLLKSIKKIGKGLVSNCFVFDVYCGESIGEGYKSVAIRITYQDTAKTLTDNEVTLVHNNILEGLGKEFKAALRS